MTGCRLDKSVLITQFKWQGKFGPFEIKSHCNECDLTTALLKKMVEEEFKGLDVWFEVKPWLDNIFYCLARGAWHAPIIMVNGKKFFQFSERHPLFDKNKLIELVKKYLPGLSC